MDLLFVDAETFYDSKNKYSLKSISKIEYVRSALFTLHGIAIARNNAPVKWWMPGEDFTLAYSWGKSVVVAHECKFDGLILSEKYGIKPQKWVDTKAMSRSILGKRIKNHSLASLAEYFNLPKKTEMKTDGLKELSMELKENIKNRGLQDVFLLREIYKRLEPAFPKSQYFFMNQTIQMFVEPKLQLNVALLEKTAKEEAERKLKIFNEIGIDKKEFASNVKFPELLKAKGYEVPTKVSSRTGKTIPAIALGDPDFINMLQTGNQELKGLCEARVAAKSTLLETRAGKLAAIGKTGLWPFDVEFSGATQTHRYSGGNGAGGNPQNFTRNSALREAVEAPRGYKLVVGDFAQIEPRLQAYLSKDAGLIQAFESGDPYCDAASSYYQRKIVKEDDLERRFGKEMIIALGYGLGGLKFKDRVKLKVGINITVEESKKAVDLYRARYNRIPLLWGRLEDSIPLLINGKTRQLLDLPIRIEKDALILPSGLPIRYPNLRRGIGRKGKLAWLFDVYEKKKLETKELYGGFMLENICQALAGEIKKGVMRYFGELVVGEVHDEIILLVPEDEALSYAEELQKQMETSPSWLPEIKLKAGVNVGKTWAEAKT